jgi:hypothetical protein
VNGRRKLFVAIAAAFALVWVYVAIRANALAFTSDEAISFRIFHGFTGAAGRANNQLLNTVLMQWSQDLFGESEFALRLPNVLAFGLYAAGSLAMLASLRRTPAILLGAALLLADPFLLDFFGLARGYGLSLAFAAVALGALATRTRSWLRPALVCGGCVVAFYANFASLNLVLGVLAALGLESLIRRRLVSAAALVVAVAVLAPGVIRLRWLQHTHKLYYGGHTGFLHDTVVSLLQGVGYSYGRHASSWLIWPEIAVVALTVAACAWAAYIGVSRRRWGLGQQAVVALGVAVAAAKIEAAALHTLYPLNRAALSYVLLFAALVAGAFDDLLETVARAWAARALALVSAVCAVAAVANVAYHANLRVAPAWRYDASSRQVIDAAIAYRRDHPRPGKWRLISGAMRRYALDYYRIRFHLTWLEPITRAPVSSSRGDLYDVNVADLSQLPPGTKLIARFPETNSELRAR